MSDWKTVFHNRMHRFGKAHPKNQDGVPVSIKIRVTSGCFHREHSPTAYKIIDEYLQEIPEDECFSFEEHESGPEILVFLAVATAGLSLTKSIIDLVTTIIKARSESVKNGDYAKGPVELIVRRTADNDGVREEKILRFGHHDRIDQHAIEKGLLDALDRLLKKND